MSYTLRCQDCRFFCQSDLGTVREKAHVHEGEARHRVQVWPTARIIAPLPREVWAMASAPSAQAGEQR